VKENDTEELSNSMFLNFITNSFLVILLIITPRGVARFSTLWQNSDQVAHRHVPLSPSRVICYWQWCNPAWKALVSLAENNGSLPLALRLLTSRTQDECLKTGRFWPQLSYRVWYYPYC